MKKLVKTLIILLVVGYTSLLGWLYVNQRSLLYFPDKHIKNVNEYNLDHTREVFLITSDGLHIQTWYHLPQKHKPMVIWFHGNARNLGNRESKFRELLHLGYGFIASSWRGFGKSDGHPTKEGLYNDARATIAFLKQLGFKTEDTILIGESLGSGIAMQMAVENKFRGVFLITPYTSVADRAQEIYWYLPVKFLVLDDFTTIDKMNKINSPLLLVHGTKDDVIPHLHSLAIFQKADKPKKLITYEGKGHSNLDERAMFNEMDKFFNSANIKGENEIVEK